jgi:hypothetical protein
MPILKKKKKKKKKNPQLFKKRGDKNNYRIKMVRGNMLAIKKQLDILPN